MMKPEYIEDAKKALIEHWEEAGAEVIRRAEAVGNEIGSIAMPEFLKDCTACGGNWGGMLLSGIRRRWPDVWDAIPDDMGIYAFTDICQVLMLLGVDTTA